MGSDHEHRDRRDDDGSASTSPRAAGKRARTDRLPPSKHAPSDTTDAPARATDATGGSRVALDEPFSLHLDPAQRGTEDGQERLAAVEGAIDIAEGTAARVAAFAAARDRLDADATAQLGPSIAIQLHAAHGVHSQTGAIVNPRGGQPATLDTDRAADLGRLTPRWALLGALLPLAVEKATAELGPHRFAGRAVTAGADAHAGRDLGRAIHALRGEVAETVELLRIASEIRDQWIASEGMPSADLERAIGAQLAALLSRPVRFAFVKAALASLGLWQHLAPYAAPKAQRDPSSFGGILANSTAEPRTVADLDDAADLQTRQVGPMVDLGGFDQATAIELLRADTSFTYLDDGHTIVSRSSKNARQVLAMLQGLDARARSAVLEHFRRADVLDLFCGGLPPNAVRALDGELAAGFGQVRGILGPYYMHRGTADHSLGGILDDIPVIGGALESVTNAATFGFLRSHDASYRAQRRGDLTTEEHAANTGDAAVRSGAALALSTVGGAAGASFAKGLAGAVLGEAAGTTFGRIATTTATGIGGGAVGNVGARAGADLADGRLSSLEDYGHDALVGAAVGGVIGTGAGVAGEAAPALAAAMPAAARSRVAQLAKRFPSLPPDGPIIQGLADLSERAGATVGAAARTSIVRVIATPAQLADALAAGAVRVGDLGADALRSIGVDIGNHPGGGGLRPVPVGGHSVAPPLTDDAIEITLSASASDEASASIMEARRLDARGGGGLDEAAPLGDAPETTGGMHITNARADAARQRYATAAATRSNVGSRTPLAEHIPPPGPEFIEWWDSLTPKELNKLLADESIGGLIGAEEVIANNIRHPGGLHEWLMVKHQQQVKRWDVSLQTVLDARTRTEATIGRRFKHGSTGSTTMHRQLDMLIETSPSFDTFKTRLNEWADRELFPVRGPKGEPPAGRYYLPPELQTR